MTCSSALEPTHILTQIQCEVCAVSLRDVEAAIARGMKGNPQIVSLQPNSLADIWEDFRRVAGALGIAARGEASSGGAAGADEDLAASPAGSGAAGGLHRVDGAADGGGQLDARADRDGRRSESLRRGRKAFAVDDLGRTGGRGPGRDRRSRRAVSISRARSRKWHWHDRPPRVERFARGAYRPRAIWRTATTTSTGPGPRVVETLEILVSILKDQGPPGPWLRTTGAWRRYHELVTWR